MKKFMRIALVFALAGAALVGCTKDYSGDISDLNKEVSAIQSTLTSLQTSIQGAQSAADAAAATANTALSAAKAAATADDLKAVQTALAAAATSADLTAVDAKYAAYIPAIDAAAKSSDLEALETTITAAIAATDVKVADLQKAFEAYAEKADLDEAVKKLGELETNYIALEARVAALEAAEKEIRDLIAENKAGIEANAEDIAALQKKVEELLAQGGEFSVEAIGGQATYSKATWKPETSKAGKERLEKLAKVFPELAELKKDDVVETFGHINFIVNPSSVVLDDTYTFALFKYDGENSGVVLGNPTKGSATKAGLNVWDVEVQKPAYNEDGDVIEFNATDKKLALVVENAEGVYAQTGFCYNVQVSNGENFSLTERTTFNDEFVYDESKNEHSIDALDSIFSVIGRFKNYFIVETVDPADEEEFGIKIEGSKISFTKAPTRTDPQIAFAITAVSVNGKTAALKDTITLKYKKSVAPKIDLDAARITLGYDATKPTADPYNVPVKYNVESFGFSALEWKTVYDSLKTNTQAVSSSYINDDGKKVEGNITGKVIFFDKDGENVTDKVGVKYSDVTAFGFNVDSKTVKPETYTVIIATGDGSTFVGKGEVVVENPEACPVKLAEALCDANGVLQIVGSIANEGTGESAGSFVEYNLTNALVFSTTEAELVNVGRKYRFVDEDKVYDEDPSWVTDSTTFRVPVQGGEWNATNTDKQKLLYTPRNLSVEFKWFGNANNTGKFEFQAEAVSPIYDEAGKGANITINTKNATTGKEEVNPVIYSKPNNTTKFGQANLGKAWVSGKYVAGSTKGETFEIAAYNAKAEVKYEWKTATGDTLKLFKDWGRPNLAQPDSIAYTNVTGDSTFVVGNNNRLIEIDLEDALDFGWITADQFINFTAYPEGFKYYLTKENWDDLYSVWSPEWQTDSIYNGQYIPAGKLYNNQTDEDDILEDITKKHTEISNWNKSAASNSSKLKYQKYTLFNTLRAQAKVDTLMTDTAGESATCLYAAAHVDAEAGGITPNEVKTLPYFTCEHPENYTAYVTFAPVTNGEKIKPDTHISSITALSNAAGMKKVEIPLTLHVEDNWGMTSKKEFKVTVMIDE